MSAPLIPLTIAGAEYPAYTIPSDTLAMSTTPAGPPAPAVITRTRGDHGPNPSPLRARIEITGTSLTDAYANAYAALESAKAAPANQGRVTWYGGAFDLAALTGYDIEPAGPESVTLTLELLPAHEPTHYGVILPTSDQDPRPGLWDGNTFAGATYEHPRNTSPALPRPRTPTARVTSVGHARTYAYYPLAPIPGPGGFAHAAPYHPDEIDVTAVIRGNFSSEGLAQRVGIHLMTITESFTPIALMAHNVIADPVVFGACQITNISTSETVGPAAFLPAQQRASEWLALRLRATRQAGTEYHYQGKVWNARMNPAGEPPEWNTAGTTDLGAAPTYAGIALYHTETGRYVEAARITVAYRGAPAPTINP